MTTKQQLLEYKKNYCSSVIRRTLQLTLMCKNLGLYAFCYSRLHCIWKPWRQLYCGYFCSVQWDVEITLTCSNAQQTPQTLSLPSRVTATRQVTGRLRWADTFTTWLDVHVGFK